MEKHRYYEESESSVLSDLLSRGIIKTWTNADEYTSEYKVVRAKVLKTRYIQSSTAWIFVKDDSNGGTNQPTRESPHLTVAELEQEVAKLQDLVKELHHERQGQPQQLLRNKDLMCHSGFYTPPFDIINLEECALTLKKHVKSLAARGTQQLTEAEANHFIAGAFPSEMLYQPCQREGTKKTAQLLLHHQILCALKRVVLKPLGAYYAPKSGPPAIEIPLIPSVLVRELLSFMGDYQDRYQYNHALHVICGAFQRGYHIMAAEPDVSRGEFEALALHVVEVLAAMVSHVAVEPKDVLPSIRAAVKCQLLAKAAHPWIDLTVSGWPDVHHPLAYDPALHESEWELKADRPLSHEVVLFCQCPGIHFCPDWRAARLPCSEGPMVPPPQLTPRTYVKEQVVLLQN